MGPDEVIHQSLRLRIMATLNTLPRDDKIEFPKLKALLKATDGNLGAHISTLENAGYIAVEKDFADRKPRTRVSLTTSGRRAFEDHVAYLRQLIDGGGAEG
jgi:DNA-binding MarR family transcriptional regulator